GRFGLLSPVQPQPAPLRGSLNLPPGATMEGVAPGRRLAVSPDGRFIVFVMIAPDRSRFLWLRRTDSLTAQTLPGTDGASSPFWSPDSKFIGFLSQGRLKKVEAAGGPVVTLAPDAAATGASWNRDDVILFTTRAGAMRNISASGGTPGAVAGVDKAVHSDPVFLSDGRHFLFQAT